MSEKRVQLKWTNQHGTFRKTLRLAVAERRLKEFQHKGRKCSIDSLPEFRGEC
jgi:hypothetical protein